MALLLNKEHFVINRSSKQSLERFFCLFVHIGKFEDYTLKILIISLRVSFVGTMSGSERDPLSSKHLLG